jgi:putative ABC transport system ATP-binding protein
MLKATNLTKIYNPNNNPFTAIDNISLTIADDDSTAILGKSGSGKSTLLHLLAGLDTPTSGKVIVNNQEISSTSRKERNRIRNEEVGFVFQSFYMLSGDTVFENIALPLRIMKLDDKEIEKKVTEMLEMVELGDKIDSRVTNLSGGQKQRVCIARALVTQPSVIFADEPTGNLDSETGQTIEKLLFAVRDRAKASLVIVTHDQDLASQCSRQIYLKDGKIVDEI